MRKSGIRHVAREYALRVLYGAEIHKKLGEETPPSSFPNWWTVDDNLSVLPDAEKFAKLLYQGVHAHQDEIDAIIQKHAHHWRLNRMASVDRNILRLSVFELMYNAKIASNIILDEALELAKCYGTEESARFINGILDSISHEVRAQSLENPANHTPSSP
ncbi:MAG: transcription antitermination factor NusB [bacterium]|jgi:N utilization substance protein B|nr:transcription antitermination factor NusB [bacterium]